MKNSRGGPRGIRSQDRAGATPVSAGFDQGKAREWALGPKDRPFRRKGIAAYPNPSRSNVTPECARRTTSPRSPRPQDHFRAFSGSPMGAVAPLALAPSRPASNRSAPRSPDLPAASQLG